MLDFEKKAQCMGCTACYAVCPKNAIKMIPSSEGFYVSQIDDTLCVNCGACERVCPVINPPTEKPERNDTPTCTQAFSLDMKSRAQSTSGGIFYELAKNVLEEKGIVCGCLWDENFKATHVCTDDISIVQKMRSSKYVQSDLGNCFREIKDYVKSRKVLFTGTPCQVDALSRYIGENDNLLTCALICGGTPSPKVWQLYKEALEKKYNSKVVYVNLRSKAHKWLIALVEIRFANGKSLQEPLIQNLYGANYGKGLTLCSACFNCSAKLNTMTADLLIGDHWGLSYNELQHSKNMGMSTVFTLSPKGEKALKSICTGLYTTPGDFSVVLKANTPLLHKHPTNDRRQVFFDELDTKDILENMTENLSALTYSSVRNILCKTKTYIPISTIIWKLRNRKRQ